MSGRVPILSQGDMRETLREGVAQRYDRVAFWDRQCAARQEVVLHVDDEQDIVMGGSREHLSILTQPRCDD
jgi:hypothetical protein